MDRTPLFIGLTREVSFGGLPMMYVVLLIGASMLSFLLTKSFLLVFAVGGIGYVSLRALAAEDPKLINVWMVTMQTTPLTPALMKGEEVIYRA